MGQVERARSTWIGSGISLARGRSKAQGVKAGSPAKMTQDLLDPLVESARDLQHIHLEIQ